MTEHIANVLTEHMFADGLIECDDKEIYHYAIQVLIEKIIDGFVTGKDGKERKKTKAQDKREEDHSGMED